MVISVMDYNNNGGGGPDIPHPIKEIMTAPCVKFRNTLRHGRNELWWRKDGVRIGRGLGPDPGGNTILSVALPNRAIALLGRSSNATTSAMPM